MLKAPIIDPRAPADIAEQTRALLCEFLAQPPYNWPADADGGEAGRALTQIFAHYCGLVIDRINRAPEKNFLAFLDLLGNSAIPAHPARAAVSFGLDATVPQGSLLPAGTRVQAEPPPGVADPIFFETETDLWLTTVDLVSARQDARDVSAMIGQPIAVGEPVFRDTNPYDRNHAGFSFSFSVTADRPLPVQSLVEMYFWLDSAAYEPGAWASSAAEPPPLSWECSPNGIDSWIRVLVEDDTQSLSRSGGLRFLTPPASGWSAAKPRGFWIRANAPETPYRPPPQLRCVALNTTSAIQGATTTNEILGSSDGSPNQVLRTLKRPALPGQELAVLEQRSSTNADTWVTWSEVPDFHGSQPLHRHYTLNRQTGEVRFGDGQRGMIPPRGARSVRMTRYRVGGGAAGNVVAGTLKTLVAGSRNIGRVTNLFAAVGGADIEPADSLLNRAPRSLRHRGRAVTQEDYEDLSKLASTEVSRALCVPLQDLAADAAAPYLFIDTIDEEKAGVGKVSVIIVPGSKNPKPVPSPELMRTVQAYLAERSSAGAAVTVVGPLYLRVDVRVEVRLKSLRWKDTVERGLQDCLASFLHPLTGNQGPGWPFGRRPQESDLYPEIAKLPGIAFVSSLGITVAADDPARTDDTLRTQRFLVYSGAHTVQFI